MPLSVLYGRASACRTFHRADHSIEQMSEAVSTAVAGHVPALDRGSYSGGHEYTISDSGFLVCKFYKSKPPEPAVNKELSFRQFLTEAYGRGFFGLLSLLYGLHIVRQGKILLRKDEILFRPVGGFRPFPVDP